MPTPSLHSAGVLGFGQLLGREPSKLTEHPSSGEPSTAPSSTRSTSRAVALPSRQAALICDIVRYQIDVGMASVIVSASSRGFVSGRLDWKHRPLEDVEFSLAEVKPGYIVVGDVNVAPELFSRICWRLKVVNGRTDFSLAGISKGDRLVLESPSWALDGLTSRQSVPTSTPAKSFQPGAPKVPPEPVGSSEPADPGSCDGDFDQDFKVVQAGIIARAAPVVPRLDLANLQQKRIAAMKLKSQASAVTEADPGSAWIKVFSSLTGNSTHDDRNSARQQTACTDWWRCV